MNNTAHLLPCLTLPCLLPCPCPALPCPALPCPALPCPALPCPALPCSALPNPDDPTPSLTLSRPLWHFLTSKTLTDPRVHPRATARTRTLSPRQHSRRLAHLTVLVTRAVTRGVGVSKPTNQPTEAGGVRTWVGSLVVGEINME
ncbi:hypothetical protein Pcinc_019319 [Petrolisthes cinctipes]|uniref:Secreted protein n=1 Tax=Petrolisthes cinctipes TaxID=88211 RepID=A0AAE1FKJ9_PETCI|nr:hypothetical protein Pcinc_019319 [Petrolisthes cinctipes]